jgi:hypothetical protein
MVKLCVVTFINNISFCKDHFCIGLTQKNTEWPCKIHGIWGLWAICFASHFMVITNFVGKNINYYTDENHKRMLTKILYLTNGFICLLKVLNV